MQPHSNRLLVVVGVTVVAWILRVSLAGLACLSNPCLNGICIDDVNSSSFVCFCEDGFTGEFCGTNWDECWSSPCENGGTCTDSIAAFNCSCPSGFSGERCEWNVDECASSPCLNGGSCIDQENGFVCSCPPGYAGHFCTIDVSVCNISYPMPHIPGPRCYNGGVCLDGPGPNFTCICIDGWTGPRCDVQTNECESSPCKNGGLCIDLVADYVCGCPFGYTGKNCEMTLQMCRGINGSRLDIFGGVIVDSLGDEDDEDVCENGALCLLEPNGERVCYCVPDYHGDRCQFRYDECLLAESVSWSIGNRSDNAAGKHCQNGGECIDGVDSFSCSCPANFTGHFCECPLYISSESEIDPHCLQTSTELVTSSTTSAFSSTSFYTTKAQPSFPEILETTTKEITDISQELKTTAQYEVTSVFEEFSGTTPSFISSSKETMSTAIGATTESTESSSFFSQTEEPHGITTQTHKLFTDTTEEYQPETLTHLLTTSTKTSPELSEASTVTVSTVQGVIGEDKIWFTVHITPPVDETTSTMLTHAETEPEYHETSTETITRTSTITSQPESTAFLTLETGKTTEYITESLFTISTQTESTKTEQVLHVFTSPSTTTSETEMSLSTAYEKTDFSHTEGSDLTTYFDQFSTTESIDKEGDNATIAKTTDSYTLYTSEKTTAAPEKNITDEITVTDSVTIELSKEPEYFTSEREITESKEVTSTTYQIFPITEEIKTDAPFSTDHISEVTAISEETETSTVSDFQTPFVGIHTLPEISTKITPTTSISETSLKTDFITPTDKTPFSSTFPDVFKVTTVSIQTEKITTASTSIYEIETSVSTTEKTITTKTPADITTYTSKTTTNDSATTLDTITQSSTFSISDVDIHTVTTEEIETTAGIGCTVTPCLNGGTCYFNECECPFHYTGALCEKKRHIEVASFNGHSYLVHLLNISESLNSEPRDDNTEIQGKKINFKRQSEKATTQNITESSSTQNDPLDIKEEDLEIFDDVYDYYEDHTDSYYYTNYDDYKLEESNHTVERTDSESKDFPFTTFNESTLDYKHSSMTKKLINKKNTSSDSSNISSNTLTVSRSSLNVSHDNESSLLMHNIAYVFMKESEVKERNDSNSSVSSATKKMENNPRNRSGRSLRRLPTIFTSISVKISLQERSQKIGGWGLVTKISLGNMAKASLTINHKTGLLRFHFTCGLGRSLLFGEEDGQRWAGLGKHQTIQSMVIPVLVVLEVFPYESVLKNNPSDTRSYLQCAASLKINGQVAVKGQQRAPKPSKSSKGRDSSRFLLYLGGIPEMLLPCNQAVEDSIPGVRENINNYEHKDHYDEEEGFIGCMQDLKINGITRQIFNDALDGNGITECGETVLTGKDLEVDENPCFSLPCYGSSTCEPKSDGSWRCRCPTGWLGENCDKSVCDNNPCLYGATCLHDDVGGFVCLCPLGKGGRFCEHDLEVVKPCFDSGNGWDIEEHQPFIAYPLDHNHLSSPQLVFRFKFSPASINQIGLLAYIGDLKLPNILQTSYLSEIRDPYIESTTSTVTSETSHLTEKPINVPQDTITTPSSLFDTQTSSNEDFTSSEPSSPNPSTSITSDYSISEMPLDFVPPLDIPLFQDDAPPYLQNFSSAELFNSYSSYVFSPFAPYPYYVRQNGRDHMAVSYIRGHLVLTWDLGSGPRRIFTSKPVPSFYDNNIEDLSESLSIPPKNQSATSDNSSKSTFNSSLPEGTVIQSTLGTNSSLPVNNLNESLVFVSELNIIQEHNNTQSESNSIKETRSAKSSTNLDTPYISSLPDITDEISHLETENYQNEVEDPSPLTYEESIPPPPIDLSMPAKILPSPSPQNYYEVTIWREGQQAWLKVGDQVVRGQSPGRHYQLNAHRPFLYMGGHDANNVSTLPHDIPLHSSFSGCIFDADLRFGGGHSALNKRVALFTKGRGVGECGQDPCKLNLKSNESSPCLNGGKCIPRGSTFICLCQRPWFGALCADLGNNPCDEGIHSCKSGSTCVILPYGGYKCDCLPGSYGPFCEKEAPISWAVKLTGNRSFLGVRIPFRSWRKQSESSSEKPKREAFCIDLEIKPIRPLNGGIILYVMGSHQDEFLSLSLNKKGEPELRIGPGSSRMVGPLVIGYNGKFRKERSHPENVKARTKGNKDDRKAQAIGWQKIRIFRRGQRVFLAMDGLLYGAGTLDSPYQNLPTIRPHNNSVGSSLPLLYLGGLPDLAMLPQDAVGDIMLARPFAGCIRGLAVDWQRVPLGEGSGSYGRNAFAC